MSWIIIFPIVVIVFNVVIVFLNINYQKSKMHDNQLFDQKEFEHYKKMIRAAKDRGLKTFVTLHHFTSPLWLTKKGGWVACRSAKLFARYAKKCAQEFGDLIDVYLTINEPQIYATGSYLSGRWPPQKFSPIKTTYLIRLR